MHPVFRTLVLFAAILGLSCGIIAISTDALARQTTHHTKKHKSAKKESLAESRLKTAQMHLANLGYYKGKVDGLNGPRTKTALKNFQHAHKLKATGTLTSKTYNAIIAADKVKAMSSLPLPAQAPPPGPPPLAKFYTDHPDFYGYYDQHYENAGLLGFPQGVSSRFAKLELSENMDGPAKRYNLSLNGRPMLMIDGQPSIIGISRTYELGPEDAIILTSYQDDNPDCAYAHHLLVLREGSQNVLDIRNCTRGYQAKIANDSLFITFPEADDNRDVGATWRYDHGDLQRL